VPPGRAPLFKLMEDDYERRAAEEQAAKEAFYSEAVGTFKMARVSQLVSGEVLVRPPLGGSDPGTWCSVSPTGALEWGRGWGVGPCVTLP
jgi:hypothetical protein